MRQIALLRRRPEASRHRGSFARRLLLVLAAMLVALIAVAGAREATFRATANVLEKFRAETVGQTKRINEVRRLLDKADDAGEAYVETHDPVTGFAFAEITLEIDRGFVDIQEVGSRPERLLASSARLLWQQARGSLEKALLLPENEIGAGLDPFHDGVDAAARSSRISTRSTSTRSAMRSRRSGLTSAISCTRRS